MTFPSSWHSDPIVSNITPKLLQPLAVAGGLALATYAGICLALYNYQSKLIFRPLPTLLRTPADLGLAYEDVWLDGLHGWWIPNTNSDRVLLFCHGNYGNISYNTERIRFYHSLGFSVLAFDYRGFGQSVCHASSEAPTEQTTYADADTAWQYLVTERGVEPARITVYGHSMGGAIAIDLATHHPEMARLIVESSFTTMKDAVDAKKLYRLFPIEKMLKHPFDSLSKVEHLQVPVLYVHGAQDFDVPAELSKALYAATPNPKQLWIAPDADHNNISSLQGDTYGAVVQDFCNEQQLQSV